MQGAIIDPDFFVPGPSFFFRCEELIPANKSTGMTVVKRAGKTVGEVLKFPRPKVVFLASPSEASILAVQVKPTSQL
ncbi:hypothetical protein FM037_13875 [Shewanella psychropiezotolerans]|uniref:Uncharacterized protein n=1 Tax=Shewanella psychropiezotolerans TaxID=2593655 RepID=A0ABX5WYF0_9GAMM|nr:hypothetical protein [Shewanella psychropiezotolerans]QDO84125.1 hypothetical protein FM037_13875 [Shewanella psychropiezotolerans]